ncbi:MAG: phosphoadenosine phosphosulfate reductase family protein [Desulfobacteraceae bacterium]|nr:phosphoadenosine phosphosulfate reductase family protein [Desulfobacteraceae bacterium]
MTDKEKECAELIEKSKEVVRETFKKFKVDDLAITWTGGKDSGLGLWIIRQVCQEDGIKIPKVMTIDEFDVFQEVHDFMGKYAKEWNLDLEWCRNDDVIKAAGGKLNATVKVKDLNERNQAELKRIGFEEETFPFEAESYTGNHLMKTVMFNMYIERHNVKGIFQGLRRDEQAARVQDDYFEEKEAAHLIPGHVRIKPILHFTERLLWNTYQVYKLPYCILYEQGYRSLGAKTTSSIAEPGVPAWEQDLEHTTERAGRRQDKEQMMGRLRKLGYM